MNEWTSVDLHKTKTRHLCILTQGILCLKWPGRKEWCKLKEFWPSFDLLGQYLTLVQKALGAAYTNTNDTQRKLTRWRQQQENENSKGDWFRHSCSRLPMYIYNPSLLQATRKSIPSLSQTSRELALYLDWIWGTVFCHSLSSGMDFRTWCWIYSRDVVKAIVYHM